ncbi:MAG: alcohol dehydrogenase, partial [Candidatus Methanomethylicota archaeon]
TNPEPVEKFIGAQLVKNRGAPLIQIPTLSGTGSEVSPVSVLTRGRVKEAIWSYNIFPHTSLVDPVLATTAPPNATASSGVDALCHAIESIMSIESNEITEALSLEAIRLVSTYLERAYANGDDIEARYGLALASMLAALSFTNTMLCLGHGIAYTFSVDYNVPHGVSCGIAEPFVMEYNMPAVLDKLVSIADAFGVDILGLSLKDAAYEAIAAFRDLASSVNIPSCLKDLGVEREKLESMVDQLFTRQSRFIARNPRKPSREDMLSLYEKMWEGLG